jgi:hypothetical protein
MSDEKTDIDRRRVLASAATAAVAGLAGCSSVSVDIDGPDGGGDEGGDDESGSDDASSDGGTDASTGTFTCTDVTDGYDSQDVGARPVLADFDYPALFGEFEYVQSPDVVIFETEADLEEGTLRMELLQSTDPESDPMDVPDDGAGGATTTFNGEEVQFAGVSNNSNLTWAGNLPYQVDGERKTFSTVLTLGSTEEESMECGDALREAAEHVVTSLEVNDESTIGE